MKKHEVLGEIAEDTRSFVNQEAYVANLPDGISFIDVGKVEQLVYDEVVVYRISDNEQWTIGKVGLKNEGAKYINSPLENRNGKPRHHRARMTNEWLRNGAQVRKIDGDIASVISETVEFSWPIPQFSPPEQE